MKLNPTWQAFARYWIASGVYSQVTFVGLVVWSGFGTL